MKRRNFLASAIAVVVGSKLHAANRYRTNLDVENMQKISSVFAFDPTIDANQFADDCREWNIDFAILHPGYFEDARMIDALQKNGIKLWLNFPVFYNPSFLAKNPEYYCITSKGRKAIHDWCHFVCPNRIDYIEQLLNESEVLAKRLQPTLMSLDFIRHFVFWEAVDLNDSADKIEDGCYCPICLDAFTKYSGFKIPANSPAEYIRKKASKEWGRWKTQRITDTANRFLKILCNASPDSKILIKTVPWRQGDLDGAIINSAGQDIAALGALVDGIVPMAFTHILRQTPAWKETLLQEVKSVTGKPVLSYLQTEKVYREEDISLHQFENELSTGLAGDNAGISIFCYEQLVKAPEKTAILKKYLGAQNNGNKKILSLFDV